jgi:hypothetical protein
MDARTVEARYRSLAPVLTERSRRLWAATEAKALGHGGIALVERATGISRSTIQRGMRELDSGETVMLGREGGAQHPDRDAQFHYISREVRRLEKKAQPACVSAPSSIAGAIQAASSPATRRWPGSP